MNEYEFYRGTVPEQQLLKQTANRAEAAFERGAFNSAMVWVKVAAHFAFSRRTLIDPTLESLLLSLAQKLERQSGMSKFTSNKFRVKDYGKMRFLHVTTDGFGGNRQSSLIKHWIENTYVNSVHNLIVTSNHPPSKTLISAIGKSGGWYFSLPALTTKCCDQALFMRQFAIDWADVVVLSVQPFDPLPTVAFGVAGGPPTILCSPVSQGLCLGRRVADVVVDMENSDLLPAQGWNAYFGNLLQSLPSQHNLQKIKQTKAQSDQNFLGKQTLPEELPEYSLCRLIRYYSESLPKNDALNAQLATFPSALRKVDSFKKAKEYLFNLREFLNFTLS